MSEEPLVIVAEGSYGDVTVNSNKTLIGKARIGGGPGSSAQHFGLGSNIIIRNFNIKGGGDGITIGGGHHIWIDHCTLYKCGDGQIDIVKGSDRITISWCKFTDRHIKTMLINNGHPNKSEINRNNVTLAHNFFDAVDQRNPRAGYGMIHVLNCYYKNVGHLDDEPNPYPGYGIHVYWGARATIEGCNFLNTPDAASHHEPGNIDPGHLYYIKNKFDAISKYAPAETNPDKIFFTDKYYMHDWAVIDAEQVPEIIEKGAGVGTEWSKIGLIPTPGQGAVNVSRNPTLEWTKVGSRAANTVYFGKTFPPPKLKTVDGNSFQPGNLDEGTVYYWKINDNDVWKFRTEGQVKTNVKQYVSVNFNPDALTLYLNPGRSELKLNLSDDYSGAGIQDLILYDCLGKVIRKETTSGSEHTMHVKPLPRGVYYISLIGRQGKIVRKFIKS
jgi:pectate lyase